METKNKILITGAGGFIGSHLIDYYSIKEEEVLGTYYNPTINKKDFIDIYNKTNLIKCDIRKFRHIHEIISYFKPSIIFHLAAQSYPTISWKKPKKTIEVNVLGTINVFESIKKVKRKDDKYDPIILVACSSAEYGDTSDNDIPIRENCKLLPLHPYGVSKVAQDLLAYQYWRNLQFKVIRMRIFNTTGIRKLNDVISDFTYRAIEIEKNIILPALWVGNINTYRAILDVRDTICAFDLLYKKGKYGEVYNISAEKAYLISDLLSIIKNNIDKEFKIKVHKSLLRTSDEPIIYGDSTRLKNLGWKQKYNIEQTIIDMLNYWREKID